MGKHGRQLSNKRHIYLLNVDYEFMKTETVCINKLIFTSVQYFLKLTNTGSDNSLFQLDKWELISSPVNGPHVGLFSPLAPAICQNILNSQNFPWRSTWKDQPRLEFTLNKVFESFCSMSINVYFISCLFVAIVFW